MTDTEPRIPPLPRGTLPDDVRVALRGWLRPDATEVPTRSTHRHAFNAFGVRSDPGSE